MAEKELPDGAENPLFLRSKIVQFAHGLLGVHEIPAGSNTGPMVHKIQSSTGAYNAPWCVSTRQYIDETVLGSTYANDTANVYAYADYAEKHDDVFPHPIIGCAVAYHIGAGHMGTVVELNHNGTFWAIEGNEADAVRRVLRDPNHIKCTFILRKELQT